MAFSREIRAALELIDGVARARSPVLIEGESHRSAAELARLLHERGPACGEPFVEVDCAADEIPFESELERARCGTLFLDDLSAASPARQSELFRAIRSPVRGARIIASTTEDLDALVRAGRFREELLRFFQAPVSPSESGEDDSDGIESEYFV